MKGKKLLGSLLAVVVLLAVMATPVMAADDGTVITGNVPVVIEVDAPDGFAMPSLSPAATQPITSSVQTATVKANVAWDLTVVDSDADGKMEATGPVYLTNVMTVTGGDETTPTSLAGEVTLKSSGAVGETDITNIYFQQAVTWADAAGDYTITVTFTATAATP